MGQQVNNKPDFNLPPDDFFEGPLPGPAGPTPFGQNISFTGTPQPPFASGIPDPKLLEALTSEASPFWISGIGAAGEVLAELPVNEEIGKDTLERVLNGNSGPLSEYFAGVVADAILNTDPPIRDLWSKVFNALNNLDFISTGDAISKASAAMEAISTTGLREKIDPKIEGGTSRTVGETAKIKIDLEEKLKKGTGVDVVGNDGTYRYAGARLGVINPKTGKVMTINEIDAGKETIKFNASKKGSFHLRLQVIFENKKDASDQFAETFTQIIRVFPEND